MKRTYSKQTFLFLSCLFLTGKLFSQEALVDSSNLQSAKNGIVSNFYLAIGQQSRLYNGMEYFPYDRSIKGNALFPLDAETWATGEVTYDGFAYKGVPMMYDIYKDKLVVLLYNHFTAYTLLEDRVHDFSFSGHRFVRVNADSLVNDRSGITTGFYDQLYNGNKVEVLAKRVKTIQNSTNISATLETYFLENHSYYMRKGNTYYKVSSQGSFLDVLKDKKAVIQKYMRDNNLKFRRDPEGVMATVASYYDKL